MGRGGGLVEFSLSFRVSLGYDYLPESLQLLAAVRDLLREVQNHGEADTLIVTSEAIHGEE
jgi:hypothetical protein